MKPGKKNYVYEIIGTGFWFSFFLKKLSENGFSKNHWNQWFFDFLKNQNHKNQITTQHWQLWLCVPNLKNMGIGSGLLKI
jgi:hypothetical protein